MVSKVARLEKHDSLIVAAFSLDAYSAAFFNRIEIEIYIIKNDKEVGIDSK